jgi:hypothetical protein
MAIIINEQRTKSGLANKRHLPATAVLATLLLLSALARAAGGGQPVSKRGEPEALFAQDGRPAATALEPPTGFGLRSRAGLYASAEQLVWQARMAEPYTVVVDLDGPLPTRAALAQAINGYRWEAQNALYPQATAYFVRARSPQRAVAGADTLTAAGLPLVFVVVDGPVAGSVARAR